MSTIKEIRKLIAKNSASKALKEAAALIEKHEVLEDFENSIIGLQARLTAVEEGEMEESMDPRDIKIEKSKINKSLNFFLDKMEDELPEEEVPVVQVPATTPADEEPVMSLEESKKLEIDSLVKTISHNTRKVAKLRNDLIIESNPSTKFDLETMINELEKDLEISKTKLDQLQS